MTAKAIEGVKPATQVGGFDLYPTSTAGVMIAHEAAGVLVHITFRYPEPSLIYRHTMCCGASVDRTALRVACDECGLVIPDAESDAEYIGVWDFGVEQWFEGTLDPLRETLVASELEALAEGLVETRVAQHEASLATHSIEDLIKRGEVQPIPSPGVSVFDEASASSYLLRLV